MLQIYLASILIWVIIIYAVTTLCADKIVSNGWLNSVTPSGANRSLVTLFAVASIPIIRVLMVIALIIMASLTPAEYEVWKKDKDKFE